MQIKINYINNNHIIINLFDNTTIKKWFDYVSNKNYTYSQVFEQTPSPKEEVNVKAEWNKIENTISYLKTMGFQINFTLSSEFDYHQSTLNNLHRFFAYNMMWYDNNESIPNPIDPNFKLVDISKDQWHQIIDVINEAVHNLEKTATLTTNALSISPPTCFLSYHPNKDRDIDWLQFNETDIKKNYEYFNNIHCQYLVVLDRSILGKCVLQAFSDDDDLSAADCSGRIGSHGGFTIVDNTRLQQIYQSPKFKEWVASFNLNVNSLPYEFPIGYVLNSTFDIDDYSFVDNFLNVEFLS